MAAVVYTFNSDDDFGKYVTQLNNAALIGSVTNWFIVGYQHMITGTDLPAPSLSGLANTHTITYKDESALETALNALTLPSNYQVKNKGGQFTLTLFNGNL